MKTTLFIITGILFSCKIFSQDIIYAADGRNISAKVTEVGSTEVKYKNSANQDGPVYVMNKSDINSIKYENGTEDVFAQTSNDGKVNGYNTDPNGGTSSSSSGNVYTSSGGSNNGSYNNGRSSNWVKPLVWVAVGAALYYNSQHPAPRNYRPQPHYYSHSCNSHYTHHR